MRLAWADTVYYRPNLGPLPPSRELDRRDNRAYPHPQNPGLIEDADGYYDWAGRRLFLQTGEPDPETPGAYRYQTRPDLTDLEAPDADPMSPRYEPCWQTGRRRHGESSDPIPQPEWQQGEVTLSDFVWDRAPGNSYGHCEHFRRELSPEPEPEPSCPQPSSDPYPEFWDATEADDSFRFSSLQERAWKEFEIDSEPLAAANRECWQLACSGQESKRGWFGTVVIRLRRWVIGLFRGSKSAHTAHTALAAPSPEPAAALPAKPEPAARTAVPASPVGVQAALPGRASQPQEPVARGDMRERPRQARPEAEPRLPQLVFDRSAVDQSGGTRSFSAFERGHSVPGQDSEAVA